MKKLFGTKPIILIIILTLAALLRFWNLSGVPPSASIDEASIGYNAYSILKTGGDEYGEVPTLSHRSYDDWRRATYLYLVLPFVAILDLNVVSIRLPAVILSILTVWATYYIVLALFQKKSSVASWIAIFSAFLLAISPWHVYLSRLGHESNACFSFFMFGVLFFLQGEQGKNKLKIGLSLFFFALSLISYYSGQAFIPLFLFGTFFIFRKALLFMVLSDKKLIVALLLAFLVFVFILKGVFSPEALIRFQGTSTFKPEAHWELFQERVILRNNAVENNDIAGTILYSRHIIPIQVFIEGYLTHFNPRWLFVNSGAEPHKIPNMGLLYLWQIPFILMGIVAFLFSRSIDSKSKQLVFLWFFLSPLPGAIATQAPHAMRSYTILPVWGIFTAFGLVYLYYKWQKIRLLSLSVFAVLFVMSLQTFYKNYFIVFPKEQSKPFHYAFSKTVSYILSQQDKYQKIVFSNTDNLYQSYMLFLYHSRYDPLLYQKLGGTKSGGYAETHVFDKYEFKPVDLKKEEIQQGVLYVVNSSEVPDGQFTLKTFKNLDETEAIKVVSK